MFEKLIEWLVEVRDGIKPFFVVDVFEHAGVLRFGRYHRTVGPGLHWKIPFVDKPWEVTTCVTTVRLPAQYLTTRDGVPVSLASIVKYEIVDVEPYIKDIFDQHDVLCDVTMGAIRRAVSESEYQALIANPPEAQVATAVRRAAHRYGFKIHEVTFTSFTKARPLMLISQTPVKELDN